MYLFIFFYFCTILFQSSSAFVCWCVVDGRAGRHFLIIFALVLYTNIYIYICIYISLKSYKCKLFLNESDVHFKLIFRVV